MKRVLLICFAFASAIFAQDEGGLYRFDLDGNETLSMVGWKVRTGDDPGWADPGLDDSDWRTTHPSVVMRESRGVHWLRCRLILTGDGQDRGQLAMHIFRLRSAYEVYWDGRLLGRNGRIGRDAAHEDAAHEDAASDETGRSIGMFIVESGMMTAGEHVIAIRLSNQSRKAAFPNIGILTGYARELSRLRSMFLIRNAFILGIYLAMVFLSFGLFFSGRKKHPYLMFAVFCLLNFSRFALLLVVEYFQLSVDYLNVIDWHITIEIFVSWVLLTAFLVMYFDLRRKVLIVVCYALIVAVAPTFYGLHSHFIITLRWILLSLIYLGIGVAAVRKRESGGIIAFAGMQILMFPTYIVILRQFRLNLNVPWDLLDIGTEVLFIFCIMISISIRIKAADRSHEASRMRAQRLETELLKKNIQPHFMMNTLSTLISLIRQKPKQAIEMIHSLAQEFNIIFKHSNKRVIPIQDEIRLCEAHLALMGLRMEARYRLIAEGIPEDESIPPLVLHTLIENALTHAYAIQEDGVFRLRYNADIGRRHYRLENDGSLLGTRTRGIDADIEEGMGLKYVRARLEESYPSRWTLDYGLDDGRWVVDIVVEE